jgi:hypothetical protein
MMRIATFCSNYPPHPGGLEAVVNNVAARLAHHHEVTLVTSGWAGCTGRTEEDGMVVYRLPTFVLSTGVPTCTLCGLGEATRAVRGAELITLTGPVRRQHCRNRLARRFGFLVLTEHVGFVVTAAPP